MGMDNTNNAFRYCVLFEDPITIENMDISCRSFRRAWGSGDSDSKYCVFVPGATTKQKRNLDTAPCSIGWTKEAAGASRYCVPWASTTKALRLESFSKHCPFWARTIETTLSGTVVRFKGPHNGDNVFKRLWFVSGARTIETTLSATVVRSRGLHNSYNAFKRLWFVSGAHTIETMFSGTVVRFRGLHNNDNAFKRLVRTRGPHNRDNAFRYCSSFQGPAQ